MIKNSNVLKSVFVVGLIMLSGFTVFIPANASAQLPFKFNSYLTIEEVGQTNGTLSPAKPAKFDFKITYNLAPPTPVLERAYIPPTTVKLDINGDEPSWVTATLNKNELEMRPGQGEAQQVTLTVSVTEEAPYTQERELTLVAQTEEKPLWKQSTKTASIVYTPDFLYFVSASSEKSYAQTSPPGSYDFPVTVTNRGTYSVRFDFETRNVPDGWSVTPPNSLTVPPAEKGENQREAMVTVTPPYQFGYHDEMGSFSVDVYTTPFPIGTGRTKIDSLNFQVRNRGFSTAPNGGGAFILGTSAVTIVVLIGAAFYIIQKKKK